MLTKTDAASVERIQQSVDEVADLLRVCCPNKQLCARRKGNLGAMADESVIPLLLVSNLTGDGLDVLQGYLADLGPKRVRAS